MKRSGNWDYDRFDFSRDREGVELFKNVEKYQ